MGGYSPLSPSPLATSLGTCVIGICTSTILASSAQLNNLNNTPSTSFSTCSNRMHNDVFVIGVK